MKLILLVTAISFISYFLTTTIVDVALVGRLDFISAQKQGQKNFLSQRRTELIFRTDSNAQDFHPHS